MGKVLFGILIVVIVWLLFFAKRKLTDKHSAGQGPARGTPAAQSERMVSCVRCGVNIPESEATQDAAGKFTCGNAADCGHAPK